MVNTIDGKALKDMILGAAATLEKNKDMLDAMNVFPVPDGDTGTNMSLTMISAAKEVAAISESDLTIKSVMSALNLGSLKGARGNSGVILSQIFAGFTTAVIESDAPFTTQVMADALTRGVEYAYKAVMKPKEGTILTVAKRIAEAAQEIAPKTDNMYKQLVFCLREGEKTLKQTPEMLPVLKEAGVVDAGGAGFIVLLMGFKAVLVGEEIDSTELLSGEGIADFANVAMEEEDLTYAYCTEFFIKNLYDSVQQRDVDTYRNTLSKIGDCVLVVGDLNLVKTHVHTNEPGLALQHAQVLGELSHIKIDNMREQHRHIIDEAESVLPQAEKKVVAVVAVCTGKGICDVLADWQVDTFVEGGQSMNPSTEDILKAINGANSDNVIVLPNNKNIILAAEQAAELSDKKVIVVKTKSLPQGIAAAVAYDPDKDIHQNTERMKEAIKYVKTGQITNAVRDTKMNGSAIKEGDLIGIADGTIVVNGEKVENVMAGLLDSMVDEDSEMITVYYGEQMDEQQAGELMETVEKGYPLLDVELIYGGQPVYQYIISVE
ncbi:DAK2 domain-containing protein [Christensenellaceae bacterium OttesenSCG-928-K19]|nr:DAK2 domain-containing protein [Christensenellaceae bacterium OttesenSCG-928-K19]